VELVVPHSTRDWDEAL